MDFVRVCVCARVCVGGEGQRILFWTYVISIYIPQTKRLNLLLKRVENFMSTCLEMSPKPSFCFQVYSWNSGNTTRKSYFHVRAIQQLLSCMDPSSFCWANAENEKQPLKTIRLAAPPGTPSAEWRGSINCLCFRSGLFQDSVLQVCAAVILWTQPAVLICFWSVSCKTGQSSSALSFVYAPTSWWMFGGRRKLLGLAPPSVSFELTLCSSQLLSAMDPWSRASSLLEAGTLQGNWLRVTRSHKLNTGRFIQKTF